MAYKHPPITEAVIGINFLSPIKQAEIDSVNKKYLTHYPNHQAVANFDIAVGLTPDQAGKATTNFNKKDDGHRLATLDMTELLVLWPTSFTVSQLAPYQGWDHFFERFVRDWSLWKRVVGFQTINRVGVRYINRVDIPAKESIIEHESFLNVYPKIPDILNPLDAYAVQARVYLEDIGCQLMINSANVPSPILDHASFVVDLDISKEVTPPQSDKDIYDLLNKMRDHKNIIFEACISDHARKLFQ